MQVTRLPLVNGLVKMLENHVWFTMVMNNQLMKQLVISGYYSTSKKFTELNSDPGLFAQELLKIGDGHVDAVPSNGRSSTQDEEGDVCAGSSRSVINQAIHHVGSTRMERPSVARKTHGTVRW